MSVTVARLCERRIHNLFNTCPCLGSILVSKQKQEVIPMKKVLKVLGVVAAVALVALGVKKFFPNCCPCKK